MAEKFNATSKGKSILGYFVAGIAYVLVAGTVLGALASMVGVDSSGGLMAFGTAWANLDFLGIIMGFVTFIVLGFLVWIFAIIGIKIRRMMGNKDTEISFKKRPFILALFATGVVTSVIFFGLNQLLVGLSPNADLTNVNTLLDAVTTFNPMLIIGTILGLAVVGYLIIKIGGAIPKIGEALPDKLHH